MTENPRSVVTKQQQKRETEQTCAVAVKPMRGLVFANIGRLRQYAANEHGWGGYVWAGQGRTRAGCLSPTDADGCNAVTRRASPHRRTGFEERVFVRLSRRGIKQNTIQCFLMRVKFIVEHATIYISQTVLPTNTVTRNPETEKTNYERRNHEIVLPTEGAPFIFWTPRSVCIPGGCSAMSGARCRGTCAGQGRGGYPGRRRARR